MWKKSLQNWRPFCLGLSVVNFTESMEMHLKLEWANVCHFLEVYQCTNVVLSPWKNEHDNLKTICSLIFLAVTPCVRSELLYGIMSRPPLHNEVPLWQPTNWQADPLFVFASRKQTIVNRCKEVGNLVISCKRRVGFVTLNAFDNSFRCQRPQQRFCWHVSNSTVFTSGLPWAHIK